jgi:hypothetical protein
MGNLLYETYRSNPELREQLARAARELRSQEMERSILALARWFIHAFTRSHVRAVPSLPGAAMSFAAKAKDTLHMATKPNAAVRKSQRRPNAFNALRTGGLIGTVILSGLLLACDGSGVTDAGTALAAPTRAQTKTVAERHFIFERLDHREPNQRGTAHDSDLPGASNAAYER